MRFLVNLLRGFWGHPAHPPLTDATIGAYTVGTLIVVVGWLGFFDDRPMAEAGFLAIVGGLLFAAPTILTGWIDYIRIPRGTAMRRTGAVHWVTMVLANATYLVAAALLQRGFDTGDVPTSGAAVAVLAFLLLAFGGWVGGTVTYVYGMRVVNQSKTPTREALKPKFPPD